MAGILFALDSTVWSNQLTEYTVHNVLRQQAYLNTNQAWMILECRDESSTERGNINPPNPPDQRLLTIKMTAAWDINITWFTCMHCTLPYFVFAYNLCSTAKRAVPACYQEPTFKQTWWNMWNTVVHDCCRAISSNVTFINLSRASFWKKRAHHVQPFWGCLTLMSSHSSLK